jgi:hypothetical protein
VSSDDATDDVVLTALESSASPATEFEPPSPPPQPVEPVHVAQPEVDQAPATSDVTSVASTPEPMTATPEPITSTEEPDPLTPEGPESTQTRQ